MLTNFEKTKNVIRALAKQRLTGCEYAFCLYLLDELYGYTGHKKRESSSYSHIAKVTGFKVRMLKYAVKALETKHIILKESYSTKYGNGYHFNDPDLWGRGAIDCIPSSAIQCTISSATDCTQP